MIKKIYTHCLLLFLLFQGTSCFLYASDGGRDSLIQAHAEQTGRLLRERTTYNLLMIKEGKLENTDYLHDQLGYISPEAAMRINEVIRSYVQMSVDGTLYVLITAGPKLIAQSGNESIGVYKTQVENEAKLFTKLVYANTFYNLNWMMKDVLDASVKESQKNALLVFYLNDIEKYEKDGEMIKFRTFEPYFVAGKYFKDKSFTNRTDPPKTNDGFMKYYTYGYIEDLLKHRGIKGCPVLRMEELLEFEKFFVDQPPADLLSLPKREIEYSRALAFSDNNPELVENFEELKPGAFAFNYNVHYNARLGFPNNGLLMGVVAGDYYLHPDTEIGKIFIAKKYKGDKIEINEDDLARHYLQQLRRLDAKLLDKISESLGFCLFLEDEKNAAGLAEDRGRLEEALAELLDLTEAESNKIQEASFAYFIREISKIIFKSEYQAASKSGQEIETAKVLLRLNQAIENAGSQIDLDEAYRDYLRAVYDLMSSFPITGGNPEALSIFTDLKAKGILYYTKKGAETLIWVEGEEDKYKDSDKDYLIATLNESGKIIPVLDASAEAKLADGTLLGGNTGIPLDGNTLWLDYATGTNQKDRIIWCLASGKGCFVKGTLVWAEKGLVPIETLKEGYMVWARDEATGREALKRVSAVHVRQSRELVGLKITGEWIITTNEHPFYTRGVWKKASELKTGDLLASFNGQENPVEDCSPLDSLAFVYNLTVEDFSTYFVGENKVWVHNNYGGDELSMNIPESWTEFLSKAGSNIDQRCLWSTEEKLIALFKRGEYEADKAEKFRSLSGMQKDICFGIFEPTFNKTEKLPTLKQWAEEKGGINEYYAMINNGFCNEATKNMNAEVFVASQVIQAIIRCRVNGGKIHFRLDGIDAGIIRNCLKGKEAVDPSSIIRTVGNIPDYTIFELLNIVRNEDWLSNTIFYRYNKQFTIQENADKLQKEFEIKFYSK